MANDHEIQTPRNRRSAVRVLLALFAAALGGAWLLRRRGDAAASGATDEAARAATVEEFGRLELSDERWKEILPPKAYEVLFEEGTERPFSSPLNDEKRDGTFVCSACFLPLFTSETKFESGTGWPSFWDGIPGRLGTKRDFLLLLPRTEYHCARCDGHQGHVFDDGPPPTGLRYCNNGLALKFVPDGEALPPLRQAT
jgi:peptide-methionine (R)-S-oxide reductase